MTYKGLEAHAKHAGVPCGSDLTTMHAIASTLLSAACCMKGMKMLRNSGWLTCLTRPGKAQSVVHICINWCRLTSHKYQAH